MNLQTLLDSKNVPDVNLVGIAEHTADVLPGSLFLSVGGDVDAQRAHIETALASGAAAVLCQGDELTGLFDTIPCISVPGLANRRGELAAIFYGHPSAAMTCVGVTGTNGKTSVAYHIADLYEQVGKHCGYAGTLGWGLLDNLQDSGMTTANAVMLQRQLATFRDSDAVAASLEVSSHALAQGRAHDVELDFGVFTNLSRDHLDYHGSETAYADAKRKLFTDWSLRAAIINNDDEFGRQLLSQCRMPVVSYGRDADWSWRYESAGVGLEVTWQTPVGQYEAFLPVLADYAVANITAAVATLVADGESPESVFSKLGSLRSIPGRMQMITLADSVERAGVLPTVIVDYAHTPDALEKALRALRPFCDGELICVVGCGGDRDVGKRSLMGAIASRVADQSWFTSDNPRSEDPTRIIEQMRDGVNADRLDSVTVCTDRHSAILGSVTRANAGDIVVIAGKGHENYQEQEGQRRPFDDALEARQALESYPAQRQEVH